MNFFNTLYSSINPDRLISKTMWMGCLLVSGAILIPILFPDVFLVRHVQFEGFERATPVELRQLVQVRNGTTLWECSPQELQRLVERHPWVDEASVERHWPGTLRIIVREHEPVALLHYGDLYYVAQDGQLIVPAGTHDIDYPHLTGITPEVEALHPALPGQAIGDALRFMEELDAQDLVARSDISEVHFSTTRGFTVRTGQAELLLGFENLDRQISRLAALLEDPDFSLSRPIQVDLAPQWVAIVRPLDSDAVSG